MSEKNWKPRFLRHSCRTSASGAWPASAACGSFAGSCGGALARRIDAREAKVLTPSACIWASGRAKSEKILYTDIISRAARVQDPFLQIFETFLVRRLAPDCSRIQLASLPEDHDEARLLEAMGFETANIHMGSRNVIPWIIRDLKERPRRWLHQAARKMRDVVERDFAKWRKG